MKDLVCSIKYTPGVKSNLVKYTCNDNLIHIRLRDYDEAQTIWGFEGKLTYLLTFLVNKTINFNSELDDNQLFEAFMHSSNVAKINSVIGNVLADYGYGGLLINPNYRKKQNIKYNKFGSIKEGCYPTNPYTPINENYGVDSFLEDFGCITLVEYLFDDSYKRCKIESISSDVWYCISECSRWCS